MNISDNIELLISQLNPDEDILLIDLLKFKIKNHPFPLYTLTSKDIKRAKEGMYKIVYNTIIEDFEIGKKIRKIRKILYNTTTNHYSYYNHCTDCKQRVEKIKNHNHETWSLYTDNNNSLTCKSCNNKIYKLQDLEDSLLDKVKIIADDFLNMPELSDLINCKTLINKMRWAFYNNKPKDTSLLDKWFENKNLNTNKYATS